MGEKYRHWAFTLNNYTEDDLGKLQQLPTGAIYLVYGKEVGDAGTQHLQGFMSYRAPRRVSSLQKFFAGRAHLEVARDPPAAAAYCKKDGDFVELGVFPLRGSSKQGQRSDLHAVVQAIREGETDRKELRQKFPGVCAKYPQFVDSLILDSLPAPVIPIHTLRPWQTTLIQKLRLPPNDREIVFVVDIDGNSGKSWFVSYYQQLFGNAIRVLPGKKADMTYAFVAQLKKDSHVLFLDAPRSKQGEYIQYDFLEEVKNGRVFNTKYYSRMVEFKTLHVVVMMNEDPDSKQLSQDRFDVIRI